MRRHNLAAVLGALPRRDATTRPALALATGLTKATTSAVVAELVDLGLAELAPVERSEVKPPGGAGRPAAAVRRRPAVVASIGLELRGAELRLATLDLTGTVGERRTVALGRRRRPDAVLDAAADAVADLVADRTGDLIGGVRGVGADGGIGADAPLGRHGARAVAVGLGVAVPGLVAPDGRVLVAPPLGWEDVDLPTVLRDRLTERLSERLTERLEARPGPRARGRAGAPIALPLPISVGNEADLGARAERHHGVGLDRAGRSDRSSSDPSSSDCSSSDAASAERSSLASMESLLYLSAGVGVGAGLIVDGRAFTGAHGFAGELGHLEVEPGGDLCGCGRRGCLETVVLRAGWSGAAADAGAGRRAREALASAVSIAVDLFDPALVVLGGRLQDEAEALAPIIRAAVQRRALAARWVDYPVVAAVLGDDAAVIGAADLALDAVRADPAGVIAAVSGRVTGTP